MSEQKEKSSEEITDEDYKVAPTSADKNTINKQQRTEKREDATGENYELPAENKVKEELREGVE